MKVARIIAVEFYTHSGNTPAEVLVSTQASDAQPAGRSFEFNGTAYDMASGVLLTVSDSDGHDVKVQQVIKDAQGSVLASSEHYAMGGTIKSIAIADVLEQRLGRRSSPRHIPAHTRRVRAKGAKQQKNRLIQL